MRARLRQTARLLRSSARRFKADQQALTTALAVRTPEVTTPATDDDLELEVREWSVHRSVLRARFEVAERGSGRRPRHALVLFGSGAVRVRLGPSPEQDLHLRVPADHEGYRIGLGFVLEDGRTVVEWEPAERALRGDAAGTLFGQFLDHMHELETGCVLEVGARARSSTVYRGLVPGHLDYVGLDIKSGLNVDVVGDAHELEASVAEQSFDVVFSIATFEHLAMPWKAALSFNRVLRLGGLVYAGSHQTFPLHEVPWDYWRYSDRAWHSLFNAATGFEVLGTAMGEPASIVPMAAKAPVWGIEDHPAFLTSGVLARKIGDPKVDWPVSVSDIDDAGAYPH